MSQEGYSNWFLTRLLDAFPLRVPSLILSCDELSLQPKRTEFFYIVNLSPSGTSGSHYVVILKSKTRRYEGRGGGILYLDPLAEYVHPSNDIPNFIQENLRRGEKETRISRPVQHEDSTRCAFYCLFYGYLEFGDVKHLRLTPFKRENLKENDCIVMENLSKIFMSYYDE